MPFFDALGQADGLYMENRRSFSVGDNSTALFQFVALLDPVSETAQRWSCLLDVSTSNSDSV